MGSCKHCSVGRGVDIVKGTRASVTIRGGAHFFPKCQSLLDAIEQWFSTLGVPDVQELQFPAAPDSMAIRAEGNCSSGTSGTPKVEKHCYRVRVKMHLPIFPSSLA